MGILCLINSCAVRDGHLGTTIPRGNKYKLNTVSSSSTKLPPTLTFDIASTGIANNTT